MTDNKGITGRGTYEVMPRHGKGKPYRIEVTGEGSNDGFSSKKSWLGYTIDGATGRSRAMTTPEVEDAVLVSESKPVEV